MGGSLEAQSTPGAGSVFTVHLQRANDSAAPAAPVPTGVQERQAGPDARPFVVLYVEDNPVNVALMSAVLALREQVRVEVACDGQAGLDMARALRPDLVLLDMDLPVMDGPTVLRHLKSDPALARIPCVAVSANAMDADIKQALGAGFSDYVVKPFAMQRLLAMLDGFMAARPPAA
jgi:CheY-like chemotaxis protein